MRNADIEPVGYITAVVSVPRLMTAAIEISVTSRSSPLSCFVRSWHQRLRLKQFSRRLRMIRCLTSRQSVTVALSSGNDSVVAKEVSVALGWSPPHGSQRDIEILGYRKFFVTLVFQSDAKTTIGYTPSIGITVIQCGAGNHCIGYTKNVAISA